MARIAQPTHAALGAALAAATVTLAGTQLITNQRALTFVLSPFETFGRALGVAAMPVLFYLVLMFVAGALGWLRSWWQGALAGLVSVVVGGALGHVILIITNGAQLDGAAWGAVFAEFFGLSFPYAMTGILTAALLAPPVYRSLAWLQPGTQRLVGNVAAPVSTSAAGSAFVRIPSQAMLDAAANDDAREALNAQWEAMVAAFESHGWGTEAIAEAAHEQQSVFVGDAALVIGEQVVLARPKQDARRAELADVREVLVGAGAVLEELEAPAFFDPADVLVSDTTVYVGVGGATNASAVRQLRRLVTPRGYRVVSVPVVSGMHLSEVASVLPDGAVLVWPAAIALPETLGGFIPVPEARGAATVAFDEYTIGVSAAAPETAELIRGLGYDVVELEISEFEAAGGSLPRLSLRSRD